MSVIETQKKESVDDDEIEIRLSDIVLFLRNKRWNIIAFAIIGILIGALFAFNKPNQYISQIVVLPEIQTKNAGLSGLGSLAGLAGIDINSMSGGNVDAIRPDIYPDVLSSVPFAIYILEQPVYYSVLKKEVPLKEFFKQQSQKGIISKLFFKTYDDKPIEKYNAKNIGHTIQLTDEQENLVKQVQTSVVATFDKKTGMIKISVILPDQVVAAIVARLSLEYLTEYITSYRTEKARNQVTFLSKQVSEAKSKYEVAEYNLSNYRDKNRSLFLNTAKIEEQRLQAEFLLAQTVYNDLSKQLEQAKIKVEEESPIFKILEPAQIPLKKYAPKRSLIILGFTIAATIIGLIFYGIREFSFKFK